MKRLISTAAAVLCALPLSVLASTDEERKALAYNAYVDEAYFTVVHRYDYKTFTQSCNEESHDFLSDLPAEEKPALIVECLAETEKRWEERYKEIQAGSELKSCPEWGYAQGNEYWGKAEADMSFRPFASSTSGIIHFDGILMGLSDSDGKMQVVGDDTIILESFDDETDKINPEKIAFGRRVKGYASRDGGVETKMTSGTKKTLQGVSLHCIEPVL